jgi:hypothetical protein
MWAPYWAHRHLCMDEPRIDVLMFTNVPVVFVSTPINVLEAQIDNPKAKVPNLWPSQVFPLYKCISICRVFWTCIRNLCPLILNHFIVYICGRCCRS